MLSTVQQPLDEARRLLLGVNREVADTPFSGLDPARLCQVRCPFVIVRSRLCVVVHSRLCVVVVRVVVRVRLYVVIRCLFVIVLFVVVCYLLLPLHPARFVVPDVRLIVGGP